MDKPIIHEVTGRVEVGPWYDDEDGVYLNVVRIGQQIVAVGEGLNDPSHLANMLTAGKKYRVRISEA